MTPFRRYALFWAPPRGSALARFGASWLGWDAEAGELVPHPEVPRLPLPVAEITATPRRYGFHGTLKPPFRLAEGANVAGLDAAAAAAGGADRAVPGAAAGARPHRRLRGACPLGALPRAARSCRRLRPGARRLPRAARRARSSPGGERTSSRRRRRRT